MARVQGPHGRLCIIRRTGLWLESRESIPRRDQGPGSHPCHSSFALQAFNWFLSEVKVKISRLPSAQLRALGLRRVLLVLATTVSSPSCDPISTTLTCLHRRLYTTRTSSLVNQPRPSQQAHLARPQGYCGSESSRPLGTVPAVLFIFLDPLVRYHLQAYPRPLRLPIGLKILHLEIQQLYPSRLFKDDDPPRQSTKYEALKEHSMVQFGTAIRF